MPKEGKDINKSVFEYPAVEQLLSFDGVSNVTLEGFTMTGCDNLWVEKVGYYGGNQAGITAKGVHTQSAVFANNAKNFTVKGVTVENVAGDAVHMLGALENITVDSCSFLNIGATAVRLCDMILWSADTYLKNAVIHNNCIDNIAWYFRQNCAIYVCVARDMKITHNTMRNCSYTGISAGGSWQSTLRDPENEDWCNLYNVEIAYNRCENVMTDILDGGGIYTLGGNANSDTYKDKYLNSMHHNYVIVNENTGAGKGRFMPLYHDGASSNWHSYNNVVATHYGNAGLGSFYLQIALGKDEDPHDLTTQQAHNILAENNYFLYADRTKPEMVEGKVYTCTSEEDYIERVSFRSHARTEFHVYQKNNHLVLTDWDINDECREVMENAGCKN